MVINMVSASKSAGSFLGGIFNNPGVVILGAVAIGLLFFGPGIQRAFADLGKSISGGITGIKFPDITLPSFNFPEITLPDFSLPDFSLPDFSNVFEAPSEALGGIGEQATDLFTNLQNQFNAFIGGTETMALETPPIIVEDTGLIEDPATTCPCGSTIIQDIQGNVNQQCDPCAEVSEMVPPVINGTPSPEPSPPIDFGVTIPPSLVGETQGFTGGGPSFIGGSIFETPIANLSLSQIINMFMVSASQAANILQTAQGFTEQEEQFLNQGPVDVGGFIAGGPPVTSEQFVGQGLTPEEIFLQLVGGNISNF